MEISRLIIAVLVFSVLVVGCTSEERVLPQPEPQSVQDTSNSETAPEQDQVAEEIQEEPSSEVEESPAQEQISQSNIKEFSMTARQWEFEPSSITVKKGDRVRLSITSRDVTHGFSLIQFGVNERLTPGNTLEVDFIADKTGTFSFFCTVPCGSGHSQMRGTLIVKE